MSDHKHTSFYKRQNIKPEEKYIKYTNVKMHFEEKQEESVSDSQNFCLKWSQDSIVHDTQDVETSENKDVIVISDSSSKSNSSSPTYLCKSKSTLKKQSDSITKIYVLESSDFDTADENEKFFQAWKTNKQLSFASHIRERKSLKKNSMPYTSDESSPNNFNRNIINSTKTNSSTDSSEHIVKNISKSNVQLHNNVVNKVKPPANGAGSSSSSSNPKPNQPVKSTPSKIKAHNDYKQNLTRKDYKSIIKNIRSTKMVYESPKTFRRNDVESDEDTDDIIHPAISPKNAGKARNKIIDETPVDSESDIIQSSQANLASIYKTPLNQILTKPHANTDEGIVCTELSERKKKQISQWLMTTSPNSSDTSPSIVPASNRDDVNSGNSSLERLEMNYETPNNRGKINNNQNRVINSGSTKTTSFTMVQEATSRKLIQPTNGTPKLCTSRNNYHNNNSKPPSTAIPTVQQNVPQKLVITDCVDILDKLYGKSWREKADVLFPNSEPRKPVIPTRNRAVQTERKPKSKGKCYKPDSDDSDISLKDLKQQKRLIKTDVRKNTKQINSFINDQSTSGSEDESLYYTALIDPKASLNSVPKKPTILPSIQRAIGICDAETDDEENKTNDHPVFDLRRRKLSFSSDEIEDSSTSEFDPGDDVPPKPIFKKDSTKTSWRTPKVTATNKLVFDNQKYEKHKSFLASLSESVPIANVHPDARKYRLNYKNNKEDLCNYLYKLYNEKVFDKKLPEDMLIEWNVRMRGTAGFCYNKKSIKTLGGVVKSSRIVLATKILDTPDRLRDTLIHEMCHAAAWLINDISDGHGPYWTGWANKAMKTFPELPPIRRCHDYKIKTKYTYRCVSCGYSIGRHSKSLNTEKKRCGHCYGKFELLVNRTTKSGTVQLQTPTRGPSAFALYVKENYNSVKKERNIRHAEVMKILGQQFSAVKIAKKQNSLENDADNSV